MGALRISDEHRSAPCRPARLNVGVGIADHPGRREIKPQRGRRVQEHAGTRLATVARATQLGHNPTGMVHAQTRSIKMTTLLGELPDHPVVDCEELLHGDLSLGSGRLIRDAHERKPRLG
jgi:hypothetical protein